MHHWVRNEKHISVITETGGEYIEHEHVTPKTGTVNDILSKIYSTACKSNILTYVQW